MTRHPPPTIHALPIGARGDHVPRLACPCRPIEATDMLEGPLGRLIVVHRHAPAIADPAPPACSCPACVAFDAASAEDRSGRTPGTAERLALARERRDRAHRYGRRDPDDPVGAA